MTSTYQLVYVSSANWLYSAEELEDILNVAWSKNKRLGITGMLLYKEGNIIQALEGPKQAVEELMSVIARDPRHSGVQVLTRQMVPEREYGDWEMAYRDINSGLLKTPRYEGPVEGFSEGVIPPAISRSSRLLRLFDQNTVP